jgi:hypothetical protein
MGADWRSYCRNSNFDFEGNTVLVSLPGSRVHRVAIYDENDVYRLVSIVARPAVISEISALPLWVLERNRCTELVGFKVDPRGRLVGEAWVCKEGLTSAEFNFYLHATAAECDRFEYLLTGADAS